MKPYHVTAIVDARMNKPGWAMGAVENRAAMFQASSPRVARRKAEARWGKWLNPALQSVVVTSVRPL